MTKHMTYSAQRKARDADLLSVHIENRARGYRPPRRMIEAILRDEYVRRRAEPATIRLQLLSDTQIARLHKEFFNLPDPTDVISFPDGEADPDTGIVHLGDVAVGVRVAECEAAARGLDANREVALYALHGLLHLLGMDDRNVIGRRAMARAQAAAMRRVNID